LLELFPLSIIVAPLACCISFLLCCISSWLSPASFRLI